MTDIKTRKERRLSPEKQEALDSLRDWMPKGTRVFTILRHVSASGMSRVISLVVFRPGDEYPIHPNYAASKLLGWPLDKKREGIRVSGCGMDMGFHLVYSLSQALYGRDEKGNYSEEGARALKQQWL